MKTLFFRLIVILIKHVLPCFHVSPWQLLNVIRSEMLLCGVPTRNSAPIVLGIRILLGLLHGNDIKVLVSKLVHRSRHTNQSCVQGSRNPRNFQKLYYFVFYVLRLGTQNSHYFMTVVLTKTFSGYLTTVQIRPWLFIWKWTVRSWG